MIPNFQELMLPFLKMCNDNREHSTRELTDKFIDLLKLSESDINEVMSSGQSKLANRVGWVKSYFVKSGLLISPERGKFRITERGIILLNQNLNSIDVKTLKQYPDFLNWLEKTKDTNEVSNIVEEIITITPEEELEKIYNKINNDLSLQLLEIILKNPPSFFEQLVVDLLVAMGYGGSRKDAGLALGKTGDGGIDGIIKEDLLGLDIICIQAKRYSENNTVPSREVRDFIGSLEGHGTQKGVMITTSSFSKDGIEFVNRLQQKKVVLIDGKKLTSFMIDFGIGVSTSTKYEIKKINLDYFEVN